MTDCLFCRIGAGEIPAEIVHESSAVLAFRDLAPQAATHVLVIPRVHFGTAAEVTKAAPDTMLAIWQGIAEVVGSEHLAGGYRVVFNTGPDGGQTVQHAHAHVLGGRRMSWPPG